ncbi:hypothetical protein VB711_23015 [Cronbergia sp. UHCC 0137]|uniref:hypothetical protein n=1 Tax=Cronbergia sp. UHCC 0137 TaxID=3110239 RepID=UPI002B210085|nr:hypothetical protein [Cronbergia sp. UHCC 0137]MEA5620688.1 hypothetical protein [Cronbergia sp. UHCC 0137]
MTNHINTSHPSLIDLEILSTLLEPEDTTYPWNPADEESEGYFQQLDQQFASQDWLADELTRRSPNFYDHLDTIWSQAAPTNLKHYLQTSLHQAFSAAVPLTWLNAISQKVAEVFSLQQPTNEKLVSCVRDLFPTLQIDDLLVLARPFAYSMRSESQNSSSVISNIEGREWLDLSPIEQAKMSLAIANYAIKQIDDLDQS